MTSNTRSALSDQDAANVRRLVCALNDVGVQAVITLEALEGIKGDGEMVAQLIGHTVQDIGRSSRADFSDCAPSLAIVVTLAKSAGLFPEDFLISEESLEMCLSQFWADRRAEVESE